MASPTLTDQTVVELYPLHIGAEEAGEQEVGRPDTGTFISLPPAGVDLISWLRSGLSLGEVKGHFAARYGQPPDLDDFFEGLTACGFVRLINGQPVEGSAATEPVIAPPRGWQLLAGLGSARVAWLRSRPLQALYLGIWLGVPALLLLHAELIPSAASALIHPRVMVNAAALTVLAWALFFLHELAHLLAAKASGCASFLTVSHRLHLLVAQTDLTALRTLPRQQRYGPYLAGMTWDLGLLLACTLWRLADVQSPLPRAIAFLTFTTIISQFAFFMRTDVYFVVANWLRLGNLMQDTQHWLVNLVHRTLGRPGPYDLSGIPQRELRIVRWYAGFYVAGVTVILGEFFLLGLPVLLHFVAAALAGLSAGPTQLAFWDGAGFLTIVTLNFGLLGILIWRDRRGDRTTLLRPAER